MRLISLQQAIDVLKAMQTYKLFAGDDLILVDKAQVQTELMMLPPAQPKIIRCKDCKFYGRADKRRFYRGSDCLNNRIDTIVPDRDFCSKAERREE